MSRTNNAGRFHGLMMSCLLSSVILTGCGGGGGGGSSSQTSPPPPPPPNVPTISMSGGGIKGPLVYAPLAFYEFDGSRSNFQASQSVATGTTNDKASFAGVLVPAPNPPYFLVFSSDESTQDLTTGVAPVITTMKTVVTQDMLSNGFPVYATPLTTIAVELAIANAQNTLPPYDFPKQAQLVDNFLLALPIAARQVTSTLGFGLSETVDIFRTWPVVGTDSGQGVLQATAEYRIAVEALSTLAHDIGLSTGTNADAVIAALAKDLGDGIIDGLDVDGNDIPELGTTQRDLLQDTNLNTLQIPNSQNVFVNDVETLLATEAISMNATADTTALTDGSIEISAQPAQLDPDRDRDGILNATDAFPDDAARDTDTDGDGTADDVYLLDGNLYRTGAIDIFASDTDDDNDGLLDTEELSLGTDTKLADTDNDGLLDSIENTNFGNSKTITYGIYAGTYDGSGTDPLAADSDNDGLLDGVEFATTGSTVIIIEGTNAGTYTGTGTNPSVADTDNDGLNDGDENTLGSNPFVTDSDNDGLVDGNDNCPAVSNVNQLDNNGDGVGNLCSSDLNGVWKLSMLTTDLTWNGCEAGLLNSSNDSYFSVVHDSNGNLTAVDQFGQTLMGNMTAGTNTFTLSGTRTIDPQFGATIVRNVSISGQQPINGNASGNFIILDSIDGTPTCQQDGSYTSTFVYQHSGNENYDGLYALEYLDHSRKLDGEYAQRNGLVQLQFSANDVVIHDPHPGATVTSSNYDPTTGVFHITSLLDEVEDWNQDGADDLVRETSTFTGIMLRAAGDNSGAALTFARNKATAISYNTAVYNPDISSFYVLEEQQQGYGRIKSSNAFNQTLTRPNMDGSLAQVDQLGLNNPELLVNTAQSELRIAAYLGTDTSATPLCSADFETNISVVEHYPQADMATESLRTSEYAYVACEAGPAGTVISGNVYTLAIIDDQGTPADTLDDQIVYSQQHTAQTTDAPQSSIPNRRDLRWDNAGPSQSEISSHIFIDGFINPLAAHTLSWTDTGADEYRLRFWQYNPVSGIRDHHEVRFSTTSNSIVIPAGIINSRTYSAIELSARFDNVSTGDSSWSRSQHIIIHPTINGLFNVELSHNTGGENLYLQFTMQRDSSGAALCNVIHSNVNLSCYSFTMFVDWSIDTIGVNLDDIDNQLGTSNADSVRMTMQFNDARSGTVTAGEYTGTVEMVTTELVAKTQIEADGTQGTVFQLQNPLPLFNNGQLDSGIVNLDGLGSTTQNLWDDTDTDPATDFGSVQTRYWIGDSTDAIPTGIAGDVRFNSSTATAANNVLPDGNYIANVTNQSALGANDMQYQVDYSAADASAVQAPLRTSVTVNGTLAGIGSGDTLATAINAPATFNLDWNSNVANNIGWTIVVRRLDADGSITGTIGAAVPDAEWRTTAMQAETHPALSNNAGTWSWVNDGTLDMAQQLLPGDIVQVQLISNDASNSTQGLSEAVILQLTL